MVVAVLLDTLKYEELKTQLTGTIQTLFLVDLYTQFDKRKGH